MKRVIIMGASSGIGLGLAEALASRGVPVGLAARHIKKFEELQQKYPDKITFEKIDITHHNAPELLRTLIDNLGGMDIYIHVAGIGCENLTLDPETEVRILNTNVCGFSRMLSAAYRYFRSEEKPGQIAAITSVAGTNGMGRLSAYSASKKFDQTYMVALEQLANNEHAGISFTDIRPGWVDTPLLLPDHKYPMEMTVEYVVPRIIRAIVRKERVAVIDWRWNLVVGAWRCIPNAIWTRIGMKISQPDAQLPPAKEY